MIDLATAWRPHTPGMEKSFFIADDHGDYWWVGVATDRDHFIQLLREQGAVWEVELDIGRCRYDQGIDVVLEIGQVEVRELRPDEIARRKRCHTDDERGVIPLSEAAIGDLFCSEW